MKRLYARLIALVASAVLAPLSALAGGVPWQEPINTPDRFIILTSYQNNAVFDAETGLVWERSPDATRRLWSIAQSFCNDKVVGNRKGWRLPTTQELASLVDPTRANPVLPAGHPFIDVQSNVYWSATTGASNAAQAWSLNFINGFVGTLVKSFPVFAWCVRGGQGVDPQ